MLMPSKVKNNMTTIAVSKGNAKVLANMRHGFEDYDAVITRLLNDQADVFADIIAIDNDLPQLHTAIIQLGEDSNSLYIFKNREFSKITPEAANKLMKAPKPNLTLNYEEVQLYVTTVNAKQEFKDRVQQFLEQHK